jgi:multiple sugar transport system substrate-binding protein
MTRLTAIGATLLATTCLGGAAAAQTELSLWYHGAGNQVERDILTGIVDDFNASQGDWTVVIEQFPQAAYNDSVTAAALSGELPDILDVDGPIMPNWAWAGYLAPLQIDESKLEGFLPGPIGRWNDQLYSVGLWDAAIAIFARKSILEKNGIRIPTLDEPWTRDEFDAALVTLKESGEFEYPLNLGMADKGEWYPYAFGPMLVSFGGDIVDRSTYQTAEGALNGDAAIEFGEWWQSVFERDLAPGTSQDPADWQNGFAEGKYALNYTGNWIALPALEKFGDDMLFLPAVDFGNGPKIGAASWQFAVAASSPNQEGANAFIEFTLQDKYLTAFSDGIGLIPPTKTAAAASKYYAPGAPMEVFYALSEAQGTLRPVTPGYVVQSRVFQKAVSDIADGADVPTALDTAVDEIDADIQNNQGYGHTGG